MEDKNWVFRKYWIEKKSTSDIAKILGCSRSAVSEALKRLNISMRERTHKGGIVDEGIKQKLREARKHQVFPRHRTKPERIFEDICKKNNLPFKYTGDGSFWIGKNPSVNPDFVECNGKKIAVEIFSYWHNPLKRHCKVPHSQTYEGRKKILKKYGWKLTVFWQEDLEREDAEQFILSELQKYKVL